MGSCRDLRSRKSLGIAAAIYLATSLPIALGFLTGARIATIWENDNPVTWERGLRHGDVSHYIGIVESGYSYDQYDRSNVAFFPLFPMFARGLTMTTGMSPLASLLTLSNISLCAATFLVLEYFHLRQNSCPSGNQAAILGTLALLVTPCGFFLRLPYSESLFLVILVAFFHGIEKQWPVLLVALLAGIQSALRPVGIALLPAALMFAWQQSTGRRRPIETCLALVVGSSGLLLYMLFLHVEFRDPIAFAKTQVYWSIRPNTSFGHQLTLLLAGDPIWKNYMPGPYHWSTRNSAHVLLNLQFANPILFFGTFCLTLYGFAKGILNRYEFCTAVFLLAIPYFTRGYLWAMESHGRFATVVLPAYFVAGVILERLPRWASICLLFVSLSWAVSVIALFAAGDTIH